MVMKKAAVPLSGKSWAKALVVPAIILMLAFIASGFYRPERALAVNASAQTFIARLDERIPALMRYYAVPGAVVALVKDGQTIWINAYGYADLETKRALTVDTPMRVESLSKPVTAWGIMKLAEQGRIDLDVPIRQYINNWEFPPAAIALEQVTVRQLLSHSAGLPLGDVFTVYSPLAQTPSVQEELTAEAVLITEPGTAFSYSNTGYHLLELLIEEVTGRDFSEYMEQEILIPLGMTHSSFNWSESFDRAVPVGYTLNGKPAPVYIYPEKAAGGLFATAHDIAAFTIAGMPGFARGNPVLSAQSIEALYTPVRTDLGLYSLAFDGYGLGYYTEELGNGQQAVAHGGQGKGIMTHFHAVPETGDGMIILTNSQRSWPFIACLLSDWARWQGLPSVGMGRIIWGNYGLWAVIGLIWFFVLLRVWRLATGTMARKRAVALTPFHPLAFIQAGLAVALLAGLIWCLNQKYLFLSSIFPLASGPLGVSVLALAMVLLLSALPHVPIRKKKIAYSAIRLRVFAGDHPAKRA